MVTTLRPKDTTVHCNTVIFTRVTQHAGTHPLLVAPKEIGRGPRDTVVGESRSDTADRVARHQTDYYSTRWVKPCYSYHKLTAAAAWRVSFLLYVGLPVIFFFLFGLSLNL